jgi:SAM-dependent methyltransferase
LGGFADVMAGSMADWATLSEAAKTGKPTAGFHAEMADNEFWHVLVPAIAPLSVPAAQLAGERLGIAKAGAIRWLDVGGGSGIWSALWLGANKQAKGVQLDWPIVNKIAKGFVGNFGVADRFETIDGDFHVVDFGSGQYDYAIYGNIAHQEAPAANIEVFRKFRKALKPGGTLIINDFILTDERKGHPVALMFAAQMLLATQGGNAWREADYRTWLAEAGFKSVELVPTDGPATVVLAK